MRTLVLILMTSITVLASESFFKSKEDIIFRTPDKYKFSTIGKIPEFKGVVDRVYFKSHDLKRADVYRFATERIKVDKKFCALVVEKIFGLKDSKLFMLKSLEITDSNKGKICEAYIADKTKPKTKDDGYHRFVTIGFINSDATALVYHLSAMNDGIKTESREFWNSLR